MNGNPYYVAPLGGLNIGKTTSDIMEGARMRNRQKEMMEQAPVVMQRGNPDEIADFMVKYPEMSEQMRNAVGYKRQSNILGMVDTAKSILSGADPADALGQHIQGAALSGENVQRPMETLGKTLSDPVYATQWAERIVALYEPDTYKTLKASMGAGTASDDPAELQTFKFLISELSDEDKAKATRVKLGLDPRASEDAVTKASKAFATEAAKLRARLNLEPSVAEAVTAAKNESKAEAETRKTEKSNESAWAVYDNAMSNLAGAMAGTETGPVAGWIPAVTSNQQIAEGAVAVMAPVLKQMFRAAGEGVFTDKDQELLMKMVPTRKDTPEARVAKIKAIDSVVRAKLGQSEIAPDATTPDKPQYQEGQTATGPDGQRVIYRNGRWEAM